MKIINPPYEKIAGLLEKNKYKPDRAYRLSGQCVTLPVQDGVLLYHTLTSELLLLDSEEAGLLDQLPGSVPDELRELAVKRVLVPVDTDEMIYCDQLRRVLALAVPKEDALTSYTILTTTDCNARCFYCYEKGRSRIPMSEKTAQDVGKYITDHSKGKKVSLHWFGGEPLYNTPAIDTIIGVLNENGVDFSSSMISNGYLFDEELVEKAKTKWKLRRIQITLDGTEEVYNRRKANIYREGSAYQLVLRNIGLLLEADIPVSIRLNVDMENQRDLLALVDELAERFAKYHGFSVYNHIIFEEPGEKRTPEQRRELYQASDALTDHIYACGLQKKNTVPRSFKTNRCMADNDSSTTITPEGCLGKCEHYTEHDEMWGSLYSEEKDDAMLEDWKERLVFPDCRSCFYYPLCVRLKKCPDIPEYCDPEYREQEKKRMQRQMLYSYEKWQDNSHSGEESGDIDC